MRSKLAACASVSLLALAGLTTTSFAEARGQTTNPHGAPPSGQMLSHVRSGVEFPKTEDFAVRWPRQVVAPAHATNVLVIMTDDVGFAATSTFGGVIPTPALDALAKQGLRYNNFNTTAMCSPTRASLLTGRNSHNVEMGGLSDIAAGYDGYTSVIPKSSATVARILKDNGYATAMFGKGHITPSWELSQIGPFDRWPTGLGFEYFYGFLNGDTNQWTPSLYENTKFVGPPPGTDPDYLLDKDLADRAIGWIHQVKAIAPEKPFFIYYAPGSTHAPHHAPADWIAKFKGQFDDGWDVLRERIFARQKALGVIPPNTILTPRPAELSAWSSLSADEKRLAARFMEAYAAHLAYSDFQTGRLLDALREAGQLDNTLVIFIEGDNGASGEGGPSGHVFEQNLNNNVREDIGYALSRLDDIGGPLTGNMYPAGWAWAMNTPFQWFKQNASHFGGTRNGMVIAWPERISNAGELRSQFAHVSDIVPTILEATGVRAPDQVDGVTQAPYDGLSLTYTFDRANALSARRVQYFNIIDNAAIYEDGWVAATRPSQMPWELFSKSGNTDLSRRDWELYHVEKDFSQAVNLADKHPDKLKALQKLFVEEGRRNHVFPIHGIREGSAGRPSFGPRLSFTYYADATQIYVDAAPRIPGRSFEITADVDVPRGGADGVLVAQGGRFGGYSFYLVGGAPAFSFNATPPRVGGVRATRTVPKGRHRLTAKFTTDEAKPGSGGLLSLFVDGQPAAEGRIAHTPSRLWFTEGLDVGKDLLTPVSDDYKSPATFTGVVHKVQVELR